MPKPQQPELHRSGLGQTDRDGQELRAQEQRNKAPSDHEGGVAPVPEENRAGHRPEHDQDKPEGPPQ